MTLMFSMIAIAGIRIIITNGLKRRETLIVATSLGLGLGVSYDPEIFKILPASIYVLVENPICAGGLTAILLNIILLVATDRKTFCLVLPQRKRWINSKGVNDVRRTHVKSGTRQFIDVTRTVDNPEEIASALRFIEDGLLLIKQEKWNGLANGKTESIKFLTPFACATIAAN